MSDQLFDSITLPPGLRQIVDVFRLDAADLGRGTSSVFDGWRGFLRHLRAGGPLSLLSIASEHFEHFGDQAKGATESLLASPFSEVVSLGLVLQSLLADSDTAQADLRGHGDADQPGWLSTFDQRIVGRASVRTEPLDAAPTPWIVEVEFGSEVTGCLNVWINPDGSLYQLYPADEPLEDVEAFLTEIDHLEPRRPFVPVQPMQALAAIRTPAAHSATAPSERAILQWLDRSAAAR